MNRFDEVTAKLNKMYKGSEEKKDKLVTNLITWLRANRGTEDKQKYDAIQCFLADKGVYKS